MIWRCRIGHKPRPIFKTMQQKKNVVTQNGPNKQLIQIQNGGDLQCYSGGGRPESNWALDLMFLVSSPFVREDSACFPENFIPMGLNS